MATNLLEYLEHKAQVLDDSVACNDPFVKQQRAALRGFIEEVKTLQANDQRYRGIRAFLCEPDEAVQQRMGDAGSQFFEQLDEVVRGDNKALAVDRCDAIFDGLIVALAGARK